MSWISPFALPGHWYRGNLHTHTTQSDGRSTPEAVSAWYRAHGYDFLAITDHWVHTRGMQTDDHSFITISGTELDGPGYHMLALGTSCLPDAGLAQDVSALVQQVLQQGGLPFFAHPYWTGQRYHNLIGAPGVLGIGYLIRSARFCTAWVTHASGMKRSRPARLPPWQWMTGMVPPTKKGLAG